MFDKLAIPFAAALVLGFVPSAFAADLPVKAPARAPAAVVAYSWSGVYVGVSGGGAWQRHQWDFNPPLGTVNQSFSLSRWDGVFSVHGGIQRQFGQFVLGIEAGHNWLTNRDYVLHFGYGVDTTSFATARIRSYWTVGGRVGWVPTPKGMIYASGGYARGKVETSLFSVATGLQNPAFDTSVTQDGWYAGAGGEYAILPYLIFGIEYQHVDLGTAFHCRPVDCGFVSNNNHDVKTTIDVVRARLSAKLNPFP